MSYHKNVALFDHAIFIPVNSPCMKRGVNGAYSKFLIKFKLLRLASSSVFHKTGESHYLDIGKIEQLLNLRVLMI